MKMLAFEQPNFDLGPPSSGAALYAWTYEHVLFPAWQKVVHHRGIQDNLDELEATQWLTADAIAEIQLVSLKRLLEHAGTNVPYYRELFAKLGFDPRGVRSREDLDALPLLTREIILERHDDLIDPAHRGKNIRKGTSGTTGVPLRFEYCNDSETWRQALRLRGYRWAGYHIGLPTLHYWAQGNAIPTGLAATKVKVDRALRREVYVDAIKQDDESMREAAELVGRMKPHVIIGYTQATALWARFIDERGLRDWDDIPVICGAEGLTPADRAAIRKAFGPAFETYGSRETMLIAAECPAHAGMHISEENLVVEISRDGVRLEPGETGDVVVTDLHNYGMPFIRYANGDVATMSKTSGCACGRGLRKLEHVDGRRCDTLRDSRGAPIPGMLFIALFAGKKEIVSQFQVTQHIAGDVRLSVVRGREWSESEFEGLVRRFRGYLRGLPFAVDVVDSIAASKSGKRRPIVVETRETEKTEALES